MRKLVYSITLAAAIGMAGCGAGQQNKIPEEIPKQTAEATGVPGVTVTPKATAAPTEKPTTAPKVTEAPTPEVDWEEKMMQNSIISTGNNARLKKVLEKAPKRSSFHRNVLSW